MQRRQYFRANARQAKKLCQQAQWLADYLNTDLDPYDVPLEMFEQWAAEWEIPDVYDPSMLDPGQLRLFKQWASIQDPGRMFGPVSTAWPAYLYFNRAQVMPPGTWLVHFTDAKFKSFDRGSTVQGLHLSRWKTKKESVRCDRNLSDESSLFEVVWGFAYEAGKAAAAGRNARYLGRNVVLFQTDCAVEAYHTGDNEWQVMFPLCSEYNVHLGLYWESGNDWEFVFEDDVGNTDDGYANPMDFVATLKPKPRKRKR